MQDQDLSLIITRLREQHTDDEHIEVKASAQQLSNDVWKSVSAFANTEGGIVVLGLDENNDFKPVRNFAIDKVINQFIDGMGDGNPNGARVKQPPVYHIQRLSFEGSPVAVIEIEQLETTQKPCYIKGRGIVGGSYKRIDDKDIKLSPTEIYSYNNFLTPSKADRRAIEAATVDDLLTEAVDNFIEHEKSSKALRGATTKKEMMTRLNILNEKGQVTFAGLLVFGNYPQQFFPKLVVDVAMHPGIQKSDPSSSVRFLDRVICEGPVSEVIEDAYHAIAKNLRTYSIVKGAGRVDELEIPEEVLREALANAVVHREYDEYFEGEAISVDIYPDRVEITNPGGLWGGKTLNNIADGISTCRNSILMKLMSKIHLPGESGVPVEGNGSGVPLMKRAMASRALAEPKFVSKIDHFKVILGRSGTEIAENKQWLDRAGAHDLDSHEQAVAIIVKREGRASVASVRNQLGIDSDEIRKIFDSLVDEGVLKWAGEDEVELVRHSRWSKKEWFTRIKSALSQQTSKNIHEIAEEIGRSPESIRGYLKELVDEGEVIATAPPSSKARKYLLKTQ